MAEQTAPSVIHLGQYQRNDTIEREDVNKGFVKYGDKNLYPQWLTDLYRESPTHHRVVDSLVRLLVGDGIASGIETGKSVINVEKLNKIIDQCAYDWEIQGGFYIEVITNLQDDPFELNHLPFENCRLEIADEDDEINGIWYSKDWVNSRRAQYEPVYIPRLDPEKPQKRSVFMCLKSSIGSKYYPSPSYEGAIDYIELEINIGQYHNNQINNGLFPSFIINWRNGLPDTEAKMSITRELEQKVSGASNAGKFLQTWSEPGSDTTPEIIAFPISDADKQYQFLSSECRDKIMLGHGVVSPILFGVRDSSGLGNNANEMTEAVEITMRDLIIPERRLILKLLKPLTDLLGVVPEWGITSQEESSDASQAYSQQQIDSLMNLLAQRNANTITTEQAILVATSMLKIDRETAEEFFGVRVKLEDNRPELNDDDGAWYASELKKKGELISDYDEEWELVSTEHAYDSERESTFKIEDLNLSLGSEYSNAGEKSEQDSGLYKLRYAYSQNLSSKSRPFCREMVQASKEGYIFRYEDIINMGNSGVNGQFAPQGSSTYNLFDWKGGVYCHHHWVRLVFVRKREAGKFLPKSPESAQTRDGLKNDRQMGNFENSPVRTPKGAESIAPINTPTRGSLKNG